MPELCEESPVLDSTGVFEIDWVRAGESLGRSDYFYRPVLLFVQGLVALCQAGLHSVPGRCIDIRYGRSSLTIRLRGGTREPDWPSLGGDLARLATASHELPERYFSQALLALQRLKPKKLQFSSRQARVCLAGPATAPADHLSLQVLFDKSLDVRKVLNSDLSWTERLIYCPIPLRLQGRPNLGWFHATRFTNQVEVMALADDGQPAIGARFCGRVGRHLGPFDFHWECAGRMNPVRSALVSLEYGGRTALRVVLPHSASALPGSREIPRVGMIARLGVQNIDSEPYGWLVPVRFGVTLDTTMELSNDSRIPFEIVAPVDHLSADLAGELIDDGEYREFLRDLELRYGELLNRLAERLDTSKPDEDGRRRTSITRRYSWERILMGSALCLGAYSIKFSNIPPSLSMLVVAQMLVLPDSMGDFYRKGLWMKVLRLGLLSALRQPVEQAFTYQQFVHLLVGYLQGFGGPELLVCPSRGPENQGCLRIVLREPRLDTAQFPHLEPLSQLARRRPQGLTSLRAFVLDSRGQASLPVQIWGTSCLGKPGPKDWSFWGAFARVLKETHFSWNSALVLEIEGLLPHWMADSSRCYTVKNPPSQEDPVRLDDDIFPVLMDSSQDGARESWRLFVGDGL